MAVATALAVTAAVVTAAGAIRAGQAAKNQAEFQAQVARQQGTRAKQVSEARERDFRRSVSREIAATRARAGGAGVDIGAGSSLLALEDFVAEAEVDALTIRQTGDIQNLRLQQQASLLETRGKEAQRAGFFRAGASLLTGFSNVGKFGGGGVDTTQQFSSSSPTAPSNLP